MAEHENEATANAIRLAIDLMRVALQLLDSANAHSAAPHLQMALDVAACIPTLKPGDELPGDPTVAIDSTLVRALGGALAVFTAVLSRKDISSLKEVADILGIQAESSTETSLAEGLILSSWGDILRDLGQRTSTGDISN